MKFITVVVAALAGTALSAPMKRSVVSQVAGMLSGVTGGTGVDNLESELQGALGGVVGAIENAIGGSLAGKFVDLAKGGLSTGAVQSVGEAIAMVQQGVPIDTVNSYLNVVTGGTVSNLEETLGVSDLEGVVGGAAGGATNVAGVGSIL